MDYSDFSLIKAQKEAGDPVFGSKFHANSLKESDI